MEKSNSNHYITLPQFHAAQPPQQINETYLAKIINMRVQNDILDQVKREIENSGYADKLRAGVVLTGGGATLRHIKELCQYTLQKPVRIGIPEYGFMRNIPNDLKHPMYATALGLLKYGIMKTEQAEEEEGGSKTTPEAEEPVVKVKKPEKKPEAEKKPKKKKNENDEFNSGITNFIMRKIQEFFDGLLDKTS